jgi:DNA replication protein DnaC
MTAPLLLLDEVGGEQKTATNAVKDVIFERMDSDLPTWITTGFRSDELLAMYGDGALRRLTENVTVLRFGGKA